MENREFSAGERKSEKDREGSLGAAALNPSIPDEFSWTGWKIQNPERIRKEDEIEAVAGTALCGEAFRDSQKNLPEGRFCEP